MSRYIRSPMRREMITANFACLLLVVGAICASANDYKYEIDDSQPEHVVTLKKGQRQLRTPIENYAQGAIEMHQRFSSQNLERRCRAYAHLFKLLDPERLKDATRPKTVWLDTIDALIKVATWDEDEYKQLYEQYRSDTTGKLFRTAIEDLEMSKQIGATYKELVDCAKDAGILSKFLDMARRKKFIEQADAQMLEDNTVLSYDPTELVRPSDEALEEARVEVEQYDDDTLKKLRQKLRSPEPTQSDPEPQRHEPGRLEIKPVEPQQSELEHQASDADQLEPELHPSEPEQLEPEVQPAEPEQWEQEPQASDADQFEPEQQEREPQKSDVEQLQPEQLEKEVQPAEPEQWDLELEASDAEQSKPELEQEQPELEHQVSDADQPEPELQPSKLEQVEPEQWELEPQASDAGQFEPENQVSDADQLEQELQPSEPEQLEPEVKPVDPEQSDPAPEASDAEQLEQEPRLPETKEAGVELPSPSLSEAKIEEYIGYIDHVKRLVGELGKVNPKEGIKKMLPSVVTNMIKYWSQLVEADKILDPTSETSRSVKDCLSRNHAFALKMHEIQSNYAAARRIIAAGSRNAILAGLKRWTYAPKKLNELVKLIEDSDVQVVAKLQREENRSKKAAMTSRQF